MAPIPSGPGAIRCAPGTLELNADRTADERRTLVIVNTGDRPVQIGSHIHLPDGQRRPGLRPGGGRTGSGSTSRAGTSQRFEPGASRAVRDRRAAGPAAGARDPDPARRAASSMVEISREAYAALYGPTTGDQVRLGDTDLWIEVEDDLTFGGEEAVFGGGKSIRESMAQGAAYHAPRARSTPSSPTRSCSTTGASCGPTSASRDGRIVALGRAGNPDIADGVAPRPRDRSGHRRHLRRGQDPHRRRRSTRTCTCCRRRRSHEALATGHHHPRRRRHRPVRGLQGDHGHPGRLAPAGGPPRAWTTSRSTCCCMGKGNTVSRRGPGRAGAGRRGGYKVHEDWGSTPGGDRRRAARGRRVRPAGGAALRQPQRGRATSSRRCAAIGGR